MAIRQADSPFPVFKPARPVLDAPLPLGDYALPGRGRVAVAAWQTASPSLPPSLLRAASEPCVYSLFGLAPSTSGGPRRTWVGYTGQTTANGTRMRASLARLRLTTSAELRGVVLLHITGYTPVLRDEALRVLEAETIGDQALRRRQIQHNSSAPAARQAMRDWGIDDAALRVRVPQVLAAVRTGEAVLGIGRSAWEHRGTSALRDQVAVGALHLADSTGRVGQLSDFIRRVGERFPRIAARSIACPADSIRRDVRNREPVLVLARVVLDDEGVVRVTTRGRDALG